MNLIKSKKNSHLGITLITFTLLTYNFLLIILNQLQMHIINKVIIRDAQYKLLIFVLILLYCILKKKITIFKLDILSYIYIIFIGYLMIDVFTISLFNGNDLSTAINLLGRGYSAFIVGAFFYLIKEKINMERVFKFIVLFCLINLVISFIQEKNNSILFEYLYDQHGNAIFNSIEFGLDNFRSVGITSSGYNLGLILVFLLTIGISLIFSKEKKIMGVDRKLFILIIPFALIGIYFTQTRNIYFFAVYVIIYILGYYNLPSIIKRVFIFVYPIIMPLLYFLFIYYITFKKNIFSAIGIFSTNTFIVRLNIFRENIDLLKSSSIFNILLGNGEREIDNILLYWINGIGIIGMLLIIILIAILYYKLNKLNELDTLSVGLSAYLSSIFFIGIFNLLPFEYYFFSIILSSIWIRERERFYYKL